MPSKEIEAALAHAHAESTKVLKTTEPLDVMRAKLDAKTALQPRDPLCGFEAVDAGGVPGVWVNPPDLSTDIVFLFFHGGAYVKGNVAASHGALTCHCRKLGGRALSVDYRVAPENPFPAALDDALMAYQHLLATSHLAGRIVVSGSSAGGGLALALMIACRDRGLPQPRAVVPISPWADLTQSNAEMDDLADRDPELTKPYLDRFAKAYAGDHDPRHPLISPALADYSGIESAILLQCGSEEILLGDSRAVLENARAAGVDARLEVYGRCYHGWQNAGDAIPEAADATQSIAAFVREVCGR